MIAPPWAIDTTRFGGDEATIPPFVNSASTAKTDTFAATRRARIYFPFLLSSFFFFFSFSYSAEYGGFFPTIPTIRSTEHSSYRLIMD